MALVAIHLREDGPAPEATLLGEVPGRRFIAVSFGNGLSVYLPGYDAACVQSARAVALTLTSAANALERLLPAKETL
jgi:hypothetical protein